MNKKIANIHNHPPKINVVVERFPTREIQSKTPYVDGKTHGVSIYWGRGESKQRQRMSSNGKTHGMETWWWENGNKRNELMWRNDIRHGMETDLYESGDKRWEIYYFRGEAYAMIAWDKYGNVTIANFPEVTCPQANRIKHTQINDKKHGAQT